MVKYEEISVMTKSRTEWADITSSVQGVVDSSGVRSGICIVSSLHTTAAITINENADPDVGRDFFYKLNKIVDRDAAFRHGEGNSDSHIKASLVGFSCQVPIQDGKLVLGTWQSVYFCEFDGPRGHRQSSVTVLGE